jgi:polysaccharide export outer membrane protein
MARAYRGLFQPAAVPAAVLLAMLLASLPAVAEYRLDIGDTLNVSVMGVPELRPHAKVDLDGEIALPLIGNIYVVGMSLAELRAKLKQLLPAKIIRQRTPDGRQELVGIDPDEIIVDIVEYRPIYVNGDVAKPGEQAFRAGLTVRQAISLAGGYDIMHFRMNNPFLESADLRAEYNSLWTDFSKEQAHVWRLETELGHEPNGASKDDAKSPIPAYVVAQIAEAEAEKLKLNEADNKKEKAYLQRELDESALQLASLLEDQQRERREIEADLTEIKKVRDLSAKGLVTTSRYAEERRSMLLSEIRVLQTNAQVAQVKREREELGRKLERVDDQRRMALLHDLEDAHVKLSQIRTRLEAVGEKLLYTGAVKSQLVRGTGSKPQIAIFRNGPTRIVADGDTILLPGDVIDVALEAKLTIDTPMR